MSAMRQRAAFVLALAALGGCSDRRAAPPPSIAAPLPPPAPPAAAPPVFVGVIAPAAAVDVTAPFTTLVERVDAKLGAIVAPGDPLVTLDQRPLREQLAESRTRLRGLETDRVRAKVDKRDADAQLVVERDSFAAGVSAASAVQNAEFAAERAGIAVKRAAIAVDEQRAIIAAQEALLRDSTLRAPIAGSVAMVYADRGARVTEGQALVRVIGSGDVIVKFAMPAGAATGVAVGATLRLDVDGTAGAVPAVVTRVSPELDPVAQMVLAEARLDAGAPALQPGAVCRVRLQ